MISERSYDTEDWSNGADNSALPSQEYITFKIDSNGKQLFFVLYNDVFIAETNLDQFEVSYENKVAF